MNKSINFYPTIDSGLLSEIKLSCSFQFFSYVENEKKFNEIHSFIDENRFITLDSKSEFDKELQDLCVRVVLSIENPSLLFGKNGVAPTNSIIGVAVEIFSQKSKYRNTAISKTSIESNGDKQKYICELIIPKKTILDQVEINTHLYLAKGVFELDETEAFLNNKQGTLLGLVDKKTLFLSGAGSLFPINNIVMDSKKLWEINIDYENPEEDLLSESISLNLNVKNKDFEFLDPSSKSYCSRLIYEVMANAVTVLLLDLKEKGYLDNLNGMYESGSVLEFAKYLKNRLNIDFSDAHAISSSLHEYLNGDE